MVSGVIDFSTNQKAVNFLVFQRYLGNGKKFLDEIFCIAFRNFSEFFTIELLPIRPPFNNYNEAETESVHFHRVRASAERGHGARPLTLKVCHPLLLTIHITNIQLNYYFFNQIVRLCFQPKSTLEVF